MRKATLFFLLLPCLLFAADMREYLQTPEDIKRLGLFTSLLDMAQKREKPAGVIPETLHFIWLGPKPFPEKSVARIKGWIDRHPGWKIKFWTDLGHAAPDDRMEVHAFDQFPLEELKGLYYLCDNFGERSQLLRYAILLNEGGVYADHDTTCIQALNLLQKSYDFFCGMEPLGPTILSSSVNPSPHLLASTAGHPILKAAKQWLIKEWDRLEVQYSGSDPSSLFNRVQHRSFRALSIGIEKAYARSGRKDVIFPSHYFGLQSGKEALFCLHEHCGSWHIKENEKELKVNKLFAEVKEGVDQTYYLLWTLLVVNGALGAFLIRRIRKRVQV